MVMFGGSAYGVVGGRRVGPVAKAIGTERREKERCRKIGEEWRWEVCEEA